MHVGLQVSIFTWLTNQGSLGETFAMIAQREVGARCEHIAKAFNQE